jgi:hypothetical protein
MYALNRFRSGRIQWAALAFLLGFTALLLVICYGYLFPAMEAAKGATPTEKRGLVAYSRLLLVIILFVLFAGMLLTFRVGRFFFPRSLGTPRDKTHYPDAWAESAKRVKIPDETDEESDEPIR